MVLFTWVNASLKNHHNRVWLLATLYHTLPYTSASQIDWDISMSGERSKAM